LKKSGDQKTQDARLSKNGPGRNALRSISGRKAPKIIGGRNAGKDRAGTQGWRRPRQVAMPASRGKSGV